MTHKLFRDCTANEIIRFGDGTGPEHSIVSLDDGSALIELMEDGPNCGTQQTVPVDDTTMVWSRPSCYEPTA